MTLSRIAATLVVSFFIAASASPSKKLSPTSLLSRDCDGPICNGQCCPEVDFVCCPGINFCASSVEECPSFYQKAAFLKLVKGVKDDCEGGTSCPTGCCPYPNYYCCPDGIFCASTALTCPGGKKSSHLKLEAKRSTTSCPGMICNGGCCPHADYKCCPDQHFCAPTLEECPQVEKKAFLHAVLPLFKANCESGQTDCPGGCCPYEGYFCCLDGLHCAPNAASCP